MVETKATMIAALFPGQVELSLERCWELSATHPRIGDAVTEALHEIGRDSQSLTGEDLGDLAIVHPLLYALSAGIYSALVEEGVRFKISGGFSLGMVAAAFAGGAFSYEAGLVLAKERAKLIKLNSEQSGGGAMRMVLSDAQTVRDICAEIKGVAVSVRNTPQSTTITGPKGAVAEAVEAFRGRKIRTIDIPVKAISHHPSLEDMARRFVQTLRKVKFSTSPLRMPMVSDATGSAIRRFPSTLISTLGRQLTGPVDWVKVVGTLKREGVDTAVEMGADSILLRWISSMLPGVQVISVTDAASFEHAVSTLSTNRASP
jgi:acyl transferase domain-containing protein